MASGGALWQETQRQICGEKLWAEEYTTGSFHANNLLIENTWRNACNVAFKLHLFTPGADAVWFLYNCHTDC